MSVFFFISTYLSRRRVFFYPCVFCIRLNGVVLFGSFYFRGPEHLRAKYEIHHFFILCIRQEVPRCTTLVVFFSCLIRLAKRSGPRCVLCIEGTQECLRCCCQVHDCLKLVKLYHFKICRIVCRKI